MDKYKITLKDGTAMIIFGDDILITIRGELIFLINYENTVGLSLQLGPGEWTSFCPVG